MNTIQSVLELAENLFAKEFTFEAKFQKYTISAKDLGYRFEFDSSKRRFGCCWYTRKKITLSLAICKENLDKIETEIRNTILHEIAHAFCIHVYGKFEGRGHGFNWESIAKQIGNSGERCYKKDNVTLVKSKYSLVCDTCGKVVPKHRKPKVKYACNECCNEHNNGRYSDKYVLRLVENDI